MPARLPESRVLVVVVFSALVLVGGAEAPHSTPIALDLERLNLPDSFQQRVEERKRIDRYPDRAYATEVELGPTPYQLRARRAGEKPWAVRVVQAPVLESVVTYRAQLAKRSIPLRGFRMPMLDERQDLWPATLPHSTIAPEQRQAAEIVSRRLAFDGILPTIVRIIQVLGCDPFINDEAAGRGLLQSVGFPVDWLSYFDFQASNSNSRLVGHSFQRRIAEALAQGKSTDALLAEVQGVEFKFRPSRAGFRAAAEIGDVPPALIRLQLGGGYNNGILPGQNLDIATQLVRAMAEADFVVSVPAAVLEPVRWMAERVWPLTRTNQLTLISEPFEVTGWAQDNGKPGWILEPAKSKRVPAILTPRYASQEEGISEVIPGDSFLMDGLSAAGLTVVQSPLLFQGGNLAVVHVPRSGQRLLLIGEGEIYRNTALGLSRNQVEEAFRLEFGVDRLLVFPVGSFHMDYDVSFRQQGAELIAFVNDPGAAAKKAAQIGLDTLAKGHVLEAGEARTAENHLRQGAFAELVRLVRFALDRRRNTEGKVREGVVRLFGTNALDSASGNLKLFLVALDLLESAQVAVASEPESERREYLAALRNIGQSLQKQRILLADLGCRVVPVASFPEMRWTSNYLNGLHDPSKYLMPAFGGFYSGLDEEAAQVFAKTLGSKVKVVPIFCAESQRSIGALHCLVSLFPKPDAATDGRKP